MRRTTAGHHSPLNASRDLAEAHADPATRRRACASLSRAAAAVAACAFATLSACGGGGNGSGTASTVGDSPTGLITEFVGGAFESWGQAQFLTDIGLSPAPATQQQLNDVVNDLMGLEQQVTMAQAELVTLMGDFLNLQDQMAADNFQAQSEFLQTIEGTEYASWNQFTNAVGSQTLPQVASNSQSLSALQGLLTDSFLNTLAVQAGEMSDTGAPGDDLNGTVPDFLTSAQNLLAANMASAAAGSDNVVPLFDEYNNGLMNQYYYLVYALQQIYTIEQTVLYLQAETTDFTAVTLAEPGILDSNTYDQNYAVLNALYQSRLTQLQSLFAAAIVSDPTSVAPQPSPTPIAAKTLAGVVQGSWTDGSTCSLYVWVGILPAPDTGFSGSWNGNSLTAQCNAAPESITLSSACQTPQAVSFYSGINAAGAQAGQLQCSNPNGGAYQAPGWDNGVGYDFGGFWSNDQAKHSWLAINRPGFNSSSDPYTAPISGPLTYENNSWGTNVGNLPGVAFSSVWEYEATDGFVGTFALLGTDAGGEGGFGIQLQIQCIPGDQWCSQLGGQPSGGRLGDGSSSVCLGHQQVTLQCQDSSTATQALSYTNQPC